MGCAGRDETWVLPDCRNALVFEALLFPSWLINRHHVNFPGKTTTCIVRALSAAHPRSTTAPVPSVRPIAAPRPDRRVGVLRGLRATARKPVLLLEAPALPALIALRTMGRIAAPPAPPHRAPRVTGRHLAARGLGATTSTAALSVPIRTRAVPPVRIGHTTRNGIATPLPRSVVPQLVRRGLNLPHVLAPLRARLPRLTAAMPSARLRGTPLCRLRRSAVLFRRSHRLSIRCPCRSRWRLRCRSWPSSLSSCWR